MKRILWMLPTVAAMVAGAATTEVGVTARQNWPWDAKVYIDVTTPAGTNDIDVVAEFDYEGAHRTLELDRRALESGATFSLSPGKHALVWNPAASGFAKKISNLRISATATPRDDRTWLVLDTETGDYQYYADGAEPKNADGKPWNETKYLTRYLVFRRIPAGKKVIGYTDTERDYLRAFDSGTRTVVSRREVELTSDYYIAIYATTAGQAARLCGSASCLDCDYAVTSALTGRGAVCFQRGSNAVDQINWPSTKFRVKPTSHIGMARAKFGNRFMIDLPTSAQWLAAARPDPQWLWYDTPQYGGGKVGDSFETISNVINVISRGHRTTVGTRGAHDEPRPGGLYLPNSFGLYDVAVSRGEMMLDASGATSADTVDPVGATSATSQRIRHNTSTHDVQLHIDNAGLASMTTAANDMAPNSNSENSYRYVIHLNPPQSFGGVWE